MVGVDRLTTVWKCGDKELTILLRKLLRQMSMYGNTCYRINDTVGNLMCGNGCYEGTIRH